MLEFILSIIEPNDVYYQATLLPSERSFRMRVADLFYVMFMK